MVTFKLKIGSSNETLQSITITYFHRRSSCTEVTATRDELVNGRTTVFSSNRLSSGWQQALQETISDHKNKGNARLVVKANLIFTKKIFNLYISKMKSSHLADSRKE